MFKHPVIKFLLTVLISAAALYFAFRNVNFVSLYDEIRRINLFWIFGGIGLLFISHLIRAWRWQVILRPLKPKTNTLVAFRAVMAGYAMNNIVPRSAELVRPFIFAKHEKLFVSGIVASIMIERVTDLISIVLFLMTSLLLFPNELSRAFPNIADATVLILAILAVILVLVIIMIFSEERTLRFILKVTNKWPEKLKHAVNRAATEFSIGLVGVRAGGAFEIIIGTIGIWIFYVMSMYAALYAFPEPDLLAVGIVGAFFLRVLSGLAFLIPTPGGLGSYHFFISQALILVFNVSQPVAIAYATITHAANYILTTVLGLTFVLAEGATLKNVREVLKATEHEGTQLSIEERKAALGRRKNPAAVPIQTPTSGTTLD